LPQQHHINDILRILSPLRFIRTYLLDNNNSFHHHHFTFDMSPRFLSYSLFLVVVLSASLDGVDSWSAASTSSFGGQVLSSAVQNGARMEMKKGKANVPPQMRGQYKKQQEMAKMQREMAAATKPGPDGLPVFNLFVRTKRQNVSSSLDEKSCPHTIHKNNST
jgi:hypothetical protein